MWSYTKKQAAVPLSAYEELALSVQSASERMAELMARHADVAKRIDGPAFEAAFELCRGILTQTASKIVQPKFGLACTVLYMYKESVTKRNMPLE